MALNGVVAVILHYYTECVILNAVFMTKMWPIYDWCTYSRRLRKRGAL